MGRAVYIVFTALSLGLFVLSYFVAEPLGWFVMPIIFTLLLVFGLYLFTDHMKRVRKKLRQIIGRVKEKDKLLSRKHTVEERVLHVIPTGVIMLGDNYEIEWANDAAKEIFENALVGRTLDMIHQPLKSALESEMGSRSFIIKIYARQYQVTFFTDERTLFLSDVTLYEHLKQNYRRHTVVFGKLHLDNFEDAISVLDVQERSEIQGKLLGALDDWAEDNGFEIIPVSVMEIYAVMHRKHLDVVVENRFNILETIQSISKEHDLMVTLSGGFACAQIPLDQLADIASEALEMALSRGGDQIVVNTAGEQLKYFGGNTNTKEKRTRISSRINAQKLYALIQDAKTVFVAPHTNPDTDALGAAIGVLKIAESAGKDAFIVLDYQAIDKTVRKILQLMEYEYVSFLEKFVSIEDVLKEATPDSLLVLVDHHSENQLIHSQLLDKLPNRAIIDHHRKLPDFISDAKLSYIEPYASSSTELVVEMMHTFHKTISLNPFEATILLSGIIVDTNNFMYRTGTRTFEAAAYLRKHGADTYKVKTILRESLKEIQIKSQLLSIAQVIKKRFSLVMIPQHIDCDRSLLAQIADEMLDIDNIDAAFAIGKLDTKTIGMSARSLEGFNVQVIMEQFGGGGHLNNAGAQIESTDIESVSEKLISYLENAVQEEKPMKVILKKDLKNKGKKNDVIDVAPGYGNYLLTSGQAIEATPENMQILEDEQHKVAEEERKIIEAMKALKEKIEYRSVKLYVKISDAGKLFGKIHTKQIADAFFEQHNIEIDKRKIILDEPITALGTYEIQIRLHKEVTASFELLVLEQ